jgi:Xaa-Pro aminopeptidase
MTAYLLYGDTARHAALRHEIPLEIIDPLLHVRDGDRVLIMTSHLERARIAAALPDAEIALVDRLGLYDLVQDGMSRDDAELEVARRALREWGIERGVVPMEFPLGLADLLRGDGIELSVDEPAFKARRRAKTAAQMEGIRRACRAAEAGMAAGRDAILSAEQRDGVLHRDGEVLTAEAVRDDIRAACAAAGAPAPPDIMVVSLNSSGGHDPGSGPLPANLPIEIDLWPRDEESGCWSDMTRTFVNGDVDDETLRLREIVLESIEAVRAAVRPGVNGRALYDIACDVIEREGFPTQRTRKEGESLSHGFYFGLGHGVGLEIHEAPGLGLAGDDELVEGDVIAIEPGIEGIEGVGGVRYEDLLLVTADGSDTLTSFPYDLQ